MTTKPLRILVVDDTVVYRKAVSACLADGTGVEVVGVAANGKIALDKVRQLQPDLLTLDQEMPELDGLGVLRALQNTHDPPGVIMLSAFTTRGADITVEALRLGAFDFALKPTAGDPTAGALALARELLPKIDAFRRARGGGGAQPAARAGVAAPFARPRAAVVAEPSVAPSVKAGPRAEKADIVGIGISTGGPPALAKVIPALPADLRVPIVIVQHMPPMFTRSLAADLNRTAAVEVVEAEAGMVLRAGQVYIAPGGKQLRVARDGLDVRCEVTDDPPECNCKPAVDYLFRSLAQVYGNRACGIIMTGMGSDGTLGCRLLKRRGATIVTQDAASCVVYGMPRVPAEEGLSDKVVPLDEMARTILALVAQEAALCR